MKSLNAIVLRATRTAAFLGTLIALVCVGVVEPAQPTRVDGSTDILGPAQAPRVPDKELASRAASFKFTDLGLEGTANGINNQGQIVGTFGLLDGGEVTPLNVPGSLPGTTRAHGIDDAGTIVGAFTRPLPQTFPHGFLTAYPYDDYTRLTFELAVEVLGINNDGYMVGRSCCQRGGNPEGFVINPAGRVNFVNVPGSPFDWVSGINACGQLVGTFMEPTQSSVSFEALLSANGTYNPAGEIVGTSFKQTDITFTGFLHSHGVFTPIGFPNASRTDVNGINDAGQIVGRYEDDTGTHGFFRDVDGTFLSLDFPGATSTSAMGINNAGEIVGSFTSPGVRRAFLARRQGESHQSRGDAPMFGCPVR